MQPSVKISIGSRGAGALASCSLERVLYLQFHMPLFLELPRISTLRPIELYTSESLSAPFTASPLVNTHFSLLTLST
jgi:hypothetical protein